MKLEKVKEKLKSLDKKTIIISVLLIILIILAIVISIKKDNESKNPIDKIPKQLYKEKKLEDFKFSDIKFEYKDQIYTYIVTVTNTSDSAKDFYGVKIDLIDKNNELGSIEMYNKTTIEPGKSIELKNYSTKDYTKVKDFKYELVKETE